MKKISLLALFCGLLTVDLCAAPAVQSARVGIVATANPRGSSIGPSIRASTLRATTTTQNLKLMAACDNPFPEQYVPNRCVSMFESCIKSEDVCGTELELCPDQPSFTKNQILCQHVLQNCNADGIKALYGVNVRVEDERSICDTENNTQKITGRTFFNDQNQPISLADLRYVADSRLDLLIKEGAEWQAANAVSACKKVADNCIKNACSDTPWKCLTTDLSDDTANQMINFANASQTAIRLSPDLMQTFAANMAWENANVRNYIKEQCSHTVGANRACFITANNGELPTPSQLADNFETNAVYDNIMYSGAGARWANNRNKINEWMATATLDSVADCKNALGSCAVNACGNGSPAVCYASALESQRVVLKTGSTATKIENMCADIMSNNMACKDVLDSDNSVSKNWKDLWTEDKLGIVAELETELTSKFNIGSLERSKTECQATAKSCVMSVCGANYENCFRNRTDIVSDVVDTGDADLNNSFNRTTGVLDRAIIIGLCGEIVSNSDSCKTHMDVQAAREYQRRLGDTNNNNNAWGGAASVSSNWFSIGKDATVQKTEEVPATDSLGNKLCSSSSGLANCADQIGVCNTIITLQDGNTCYLDSPEMQSLTSYAWSVATNDLFGDIIKLAEQNAQAARRAKITAEQNKCVNNVNQGGVRRAGSAFQERYRWATLARKIYSSYNVGLKESDIKAAHNNDLEGGFCAVRVEMGSNNASTNAWLEKNPTEKYRYFTMGDLVTCGAWLTDAKMSEMAEIVIEKARTDTAAQRNTSAEDRKRNWTSVLAAVVGGGAVGTGTHFLQKGLQNANWGFGKTEVSPEQQALNQLKSIKSSGINKDTLAITEQRLKAITIQSCGISEIIAKSCSGNVVCVKGKVDGAIGQLEMCIAGGKTTQKPSMGLTLGVGGAAALATGIITHNQMKQAKNEEWERKINEAGDEAEAEFLRKMNEEIFCTVPAKPDEPFGFGMSDIVE